MKPAFSIIFFTVASGAGLGLLALCALFDLLLPGSFSTQALWRGALLGLILVAAGLASSTLHLANPRNAWRSLARVRTSWLSREAAFALALFPVAGIYIVVVAQGITGFGRALPALGTALIAGALLFCTATIYASLKPIRQWHTRWPPVNYALLGHWSGALLLAATVAAYGAVPAWLVIFAAVLGAVALAAKVAYWIGVGRGEPTTLPHAIGVDQGVRGPGAPRTVAARILDVGHSHGTFLTSEFGFVVARRYAGILRAIALALGFVLPIAFLVTGLSRWQSALTIAACCMIGLLVERWLFFAEARHTVRLYHGDPRT